MRKLVMALAVSGVAASEGARAQAAPAPRVAPQIVYDVSSALDRYTDEILFGEVWRREGAPKGFPDADVGDFDAAFAAAPGVLSPPAPQSHASPEGQPAGMGTFD